MAISAQDVKQLKEMTNCGMMDCKRALEQTNGDFDAAVKYLREQGLAKAAKKATRIAAEGLVYTKIDEAKRVGAIVEVNSETDFAAKSERFVEFVEMVAQTVIDNDVADVDALLKVKMSGTDETVQDVLTERIATISENIKIRRFARMEGDLFSYIHDGGGSIIGTLLKLEADDVNDDTVKQCAKDVCLQIAASAPQFVSQADVPANVIAEEKEVQMALAQKENETAAKPKPLNVLEKIVEGRMKKFTEEICLMDEPYIKNDEMTVAKYVASLGKNIKIVQFVRYEKGEGLQKKEENFADEVASMIK